MRPINYYSIGKWETRPQKSYQRERIALALMLPLIKESTSLLDIGCGDGWFLKQISRIQPSLDLYGIDVSMFQLGKAANQPFRLAQCNLEEGLPFEEQKFDFVYAAEIIEHVYSPDFLLSEVNRVLRNEGYLLVTTPNLCAWFNRFLFLFGVQPLFVETSTKSKLIGSGFLKRFKKGETPVGHLRIFSIGAVKDLLLDNGFEIVLIRGAVFDSGFPRWLLTIDNVFRLFSSLSSDFVILARKMRAI